MALLTVYRRSAQILHSSPVCSFAFLFRAAICLLTYVPPFFVAYFTGGELSKFPPHALPADQVMRIHIPAHACMLPGFWQYESTYREQPRVHFTRDVMVSLGGCPTAGAALGSPDRSWSTFRRHMDLLQPESIVLPLMVVRRACVSRTSRKGLYGRVRAMNEIHSGHCKHVVQRCGLLLV